MWNSSDGLQSDTIRTNQSAKRPKSIERCVNEVTQRGSPTPPSTCLDQPSRWLQVAPGYLQSSCELSTRGLSKVLNTFCSTHGHSALATGSAAFKKCWYRFAKVREWDHFLTARHRTTAFCRCLRCLSKIIYENLGHGAATLTLRSRARVRFPNCRKDLNSIFPFLYAD